MFTQSMLFPIGAITVFANESCVTAIKFEQSGSSKPNTVTNEAIKQLSEYFSGKRSKFTVALAPDGTEFQKNVWNALLKIPYGKTLAYSDVARMIGNEKAYRAVGNANANNPIPVMIPCHRVIASDGGLGGYSSGIERKAFLLKLESAMSLTT